MTSSLASQTLLSSLLVKEKGLLHMREEKRVKLARLDDFKLTSVLSLQALGRSVSLPW